MKIFLSSTYKDLKDIRSIVYDFFKLFELNIQGMEVWHSNPDEPIERCLKKVREADLYLGIIGTRYGSIDAESGKSITELEYLEAKKHSIDKLMFVMGDNYSIERKYTDTGEKSEKLSEFRNVATDDVYVSYFNDNQDFAKKLESSFVDHMKKQGITEIEVFKFKTNFEKMTTIWNDMDAPEDMKISIDVDVDEALLRMKEIINGLEQFHQSISSSYDNLENDFKDMVSKLGGDLKKYEEIPYYKNPINNRDWETITFFPNRIKALKMSYLHMKLMHLKQRALNKPWSQSLMQEIKETFDEYRKEIQTATYID